MITTQLTPNINDDATTVALYRANATVNTENASRYMKALCNHFGRKIDASYEGDSGVAHFSFGDARLEASADQLLIQAEAADADLLAQVQSVVGDHLERFATKEDLKIEWIADVNGA